MYRVWYKCLSIFLASRYFLSRRRSTRRRRILITRPSLASLRILRREFAMEISLTSFGSSQIFLFPHLSTEAASLFWSLRDTIL